VKEEQIELLRYRLKRAKEALQEARLLQNEGHHNTAVNRLYYACFYAVLSLLQTKGLGSQKHSGVRTLFNMEFVKTGEIDKQWSRFYAEMFENRQESDYAEFVQFNQHDVEQMQKQAERFVDMISQKLFSYL